MPERFYKNDIINNADPKKTYVLVDSDSFRRPYSISIENIGKCIQLRIDDEISNKLKQMNVSSVRFIDQDKNADMPPSLENLSRGDHICVDENYLYVWIPSLGKWKRALLSDW